MDVHIDNLVVVLGGWRACNDISFHVKAGGFTAVLGPNGAGKSSLLRCLYRAIKPTGGIVKIGGDDVWSLNSAQAGRRTGAVVQEHPTGFDLTVREVVTLGRLPHRTVLQRMNDHDHHAVNTAMERVGLEPMAERNITTLSGGERQRVLIARAIAQEAQVLVLDEPTNHLDIRHQLDILGLVSELDVTVIAALHDVSTAIRYADNVVVIESGTIVSSGPPATALHPDVIQRVFQVRADVASTTDGRTTLLLDTLHRAQTRSPSADNPPNRSS